MGQKTLNSCPLYHENLSFLRIYCLQYRKLHVFYLDGYSSAVSMHKEEQDQNRTPVSTTMYIILMGESTMVTLAIISLISSPLNYGISCP